MTNLTIRFGDAQDRVVRVIDTAGEVRVPIYLVRDLRGRVRLSVADEFEDDTSVRNALRDIGVALQETLGAYGYPADDAILFVEPVLLERLRIDAREVRSGVFWVDRLVTGSAWWTVRKPGPESHGQTLHALFRQGRRRTQHDGRGARTASRGRRRAAPGRRSGS